MSRQVSDRNPASVDEPTKSTVPIAQKQPWARPWWHTSPGTGPVFFYLVTIHALALVGIILFPLPSWRVLAVALVIAAIGGVGTSVCYHRSLSHRALRLNPVVETFLIFFTIFNASGALLSWVAKHRDLDKPRYRIWRPLQIPIIILSIFSWLLFGWEGFFWIGAIRLVYVLHMQMVVNSLLHMTPGLPEGVDTSRNIWWLGPLQLGARGENWHRNHHGDVNAARFGRQWWEIEVSWYVICVLKALRLASDIKPPKAERQAHRLAAST